jgi:N-dimethylarginine dimethylaminohydrolase
LNSNSKISLSVNSETGFLKSVVLGIPNDIGPVPNIEECFDPSSIYHVENNTYPTAIDISKEMTDFLEVLNKYNVKVLRPENILNLNQVFARDLGFVIQDTFLISNIIENRYNEIPAIEHIINQMSADKVLKIDSNSKIEGGDVTIFKDHVFIGASNSTDFNKYKVARTNFESVDFIKNNFPSKKVMGFELFKSDTDKNENTLHLDCCFQPVSNDLAIIAPDSFKNKSDVGYLQKLIGKSNLFYLSKEEKNNMHSNIFSISPNVVISDSRFSRLNSWLQQKDILVEEVNYSEISKMGGLFRCSTLPLIRE